jgi:hypothetical protein
VIWTSSYLRSQGDGKTNHTQIHDMMNAMKITAVGGLCLLCCTLPVSAILAGGIFQVDAASWGVAGGVGLIVIAAIGFLLATRKRLAIPGMQSCQCASVPLPRVAEETPPITCTLSASGYQERVQVIRTLASQSLISARRAPLMLHLIYEADALGEVRDLVRAEQTCCAFLEFNIAEKEDGVHVTIKAPTDAAPAADVLFGHFAPELANQQA